MQIVRLELGERSYPIQIGRGLLGQAEPILSFIAARTVAIITNETVARWYLKPLAKLFSDAGMRVVEVLLPDGERYKDWTSLNRIYDALLAARCDRQVTLVALGGGVVGDLAGFAAATYQRGVPFVQVPTTLLAQVDSSVGGKTAINHPLGKNMIGAFYQPRAVIADVATLDTLPERELKAGLAEVIKHGLIRDAAFFAWLEANMGRLLARDAEALTYAVRRSVEIKAEVVAADEREQGLRAILNFGHTFGHAIEAGMGYGAWLHGEAIASGMILAATLSQRLGGLDTSGAARVRTLIGAAGLPTAPPAFAPERWLELMALDKKSQAGQLRFILLEGIGRAIVRGDVPDLLVRQTLADPSAA